MVKDSFIKSSTVTSTAMVQVCGWITLLLGVAVIFGWVAGFDRLIRISPAFAAMAISTAVGFTLVGLALLAQGLLASSRLSTLITGACAALIGLFSALYMVENVFNVNLYIDLATFQRNAMVANPGRMALSTATCFFLFSLGILLILVAPAQLTKRWLSWLVHGLSVLVFLIGGVGVVGYMLHLPVLYEWVSLSKMALHTSMGMMVAGYGLYKLTQSRFAVSSLEDQGNAILKTTVGVIALIGTTVAIMAFSVLQQRVENVIEQDFSAQAEIQSTFYQQVIEHRLVRARVFSKNKQLVDVVKQLTQNRRNQQAIQLFDAIAIDAESYGFSSLRLEYGENYSIGLKPLSVAQLSIPLKDKENQQLVWEDVYLLKSRNAIQLDGVTIASVITEQRLPLLDDMLAKVIKSGDSVDMLVCADADGGQLKCFPNRTNARPFMLAKRLHGINVLMRDAIARKKTGSAKVEDERNVQVLAAYTPIGGSGLVMVQKIDLSEIYKPIKEQVEKVLVLTLCMMLIGFLLIRKQIQPLVKGIVVAKKQADKENQRFIAATEGSFDNFYIFEAVRDAHQQIVDFRCLYINSAGSLLINKKPGEMLGKLLLEEVPINREARLFNSYKSVIETGNPIKGEFQIDDKTINASWIYWHVAKLNDGMAIISRDITAKKKLETELIRAEKLHNTILNSATYSIIATDEKGLIISMNKAAERMLWYSRDELVEKFTPELIHDRDEIVSRAALLSVELGRQVRPGFEVLVAKTTDDISTEEEWTYVRKDGSTFPVNLSVSVLKDGGGHIYGYLGIAHDISEQKRAAEYIKHIALHDVLTGMPNRALFDDRVKVAIESAKRNKEKIGVVLLDLDHFKNINDTLGHHIGDKLLQEVSRRLMSVIRPTDTVARMGGDEFAFIFPAISDEGALTILEKIHHVFKDKVEINNHVLHVTPSFGMAKYPDNGLDIDSLMKHADLAMYRVKELGRNGYQLFKPEMLDMASIKLSLESQLTEALEKKQFELFYQPQLNLRTLRLEGFEALIRWQKTPGHYVPPNEFIPAAEENGLIVPIGDWVIRTAILQAKAFTDSFGYPIRMAINISPRQFRQASLVSNVLHTLAEFGVAADMIELEITENLMMEDIEHSIDTITRLRDAGIKIALDDFGTGYSSLSYLSKFKFDRIKIDQSFIKNCLVYPEDAALVKTIISLSKTLGMTIIAEGVETQEQLEFIQTHQCDEAQGFFVGKPMPPDKILAYPHENVLLSLTA